MRKTQKEKFSIQSEINYVIFYVDFDNERVLNACVGKLNIL